MSWNKELLKGFHDMRIFFFKIPKNPIDRKYQRYIVQTWIIMLFLAVMVIVLAYKRW